VAPDITYEVLTNEVLTKPSAASVPSERQRDPYNDALLARAITRGLDSSGNRLNPMMPRWLLSASDLQDLTAYLKRLGSEQRYCRAPSYSRPSSASVLCESNRSNRLSR
jgi:cytochrome c1